MNHPQMQVYLDQWNPPQQANRSGSFKARDMQGNQMWLGCYPDKAAQASPYVGSGQLVTIAYKTWQKNNGGTGYDIMAFVNGAPQQAAAHVPPQYQQPQQTQPQYTDPNPTPPVQPAQGRAPAAAQAPLHLTQKDYIIAAQAFGKSLIESGQANLQNMPELASQIHLLIVSCLDAHRAYTENRPYLPPQPPMDDPLPDHMQGGQMNTPTGQAIDDGFQH